MEDKAHRLVNIGMNGFSLIELLIVMAIVGVVMGAIYGVFISSNRSYRTQERVADAQQSVRVGVDFMVRDIRMAGLNPFGTAGAGMEAATGTNLRLTADLDINGATDAPLNQERVSYDFSNNALRRQLYETTASATGWQTLANNVTALSFTYLDADGTDLGDPVAAGDLDDIRTVVISMTVQERDKRGNLIEGTQRTLNTRVGCRNL